MQKYKWQYKSQFPVFSTVTVAPLHYISGMWLKPITQFFTSCPSDWVHCVCRIW